MAAVFGQLLAGGCGGSGPLPMFCDEYASGSEDALPLEIGELIDGSFRPWSDGQDVAFEWGSQGGTMITPTFRAPLGLDDTGSTEPCVRLEVTHRDPTGGSTFQGFEAAAFDTFAFRRAGVLEVPDYFDLLGYRDFPRGTELDLEVVLRGRAAVARGSLRVSLNPPGPILPDVCESLPTEGEGCLYRIYPATARITRVAPADGSEAVGSCPATTESTVVEAEIVLSEAHAACANLEPSGSTLLVVALSYLPPTACVDELGWSEGSNVEVEYLEAYAGSCSPSILRIPALDTCEAACFAAP